MTHEIMPAEPQNGLAEKSQSTALAVPKEVELSKHHEEFNRYVGYGVLLIFGVLAVKAVALGWHILTRIIF